MEKAQPELRRMKKALCEIKQEMNRKLKEDGDYE
jgi:hypothetical protein